MDRSVEKIVNFLLCNNMRPEDVESISTATFIKTMDRYVTSDLTVDRDCFRGMGAQEVDGNYVCRTEPGGRCDSIRIATVDGVYFAEYIVVVGAM